MTGVRRYLVSEVGLFTADGSDHAVGGRGMAGCSTGTSGHTHLPAEKRDAWAGQESRALEAGPDVG